MQLILILETEIYAFTYEAKNLGRFKFRFTLQGVESFVESRLANI